MKKTLFLAILAGAALAGCVKNEEAVKSDSSPERIKFDAPVVSVPTRATEIADNFPTDRNFAVYALYHEGDFASYGASTLYMNNVTCSHTGSETGNDPNEYWNPQGDYYWPKKETAKLTFAAYTPVMTAIPDGDTGAAVGVKWNADGFTFQNYQTADPTTQVDLLYSGRQFNKQNNTTDVVTDDPYDGVTIPFKHALSSIVFKAYAQTAGTVRLTGIKVVQVYSKATFKQNLSYDSENKRESETPEWSGHSSSLAECVVYNETNPTETLTADADHPMTFNSDASAANGKRRSDLLVIPQKLAATDRTTANYYEVGSGSKDAKVVITYQIKNGDTWKDQVSEYNLASGTQADQVYEWEINKRYTYNISIGLNKIYFNAQVTPYEDQDGVLTI